MILSRFNYQEKLQIKKEKEIQEIDFDFLSRKIFQQKFFCGKIFVVKFVR